MGLGAAAVVVRSVGLNIAAAGGVAHHNVAIVGPAKAGASGCHSATPSGRIGDD